MSLENILISIFCHQIAFSFYRVLRKNSKHAELHDALDIYKQGSVFVIEALDFNELSMAFPWNVDSLRSASISLKM